jgi:hypothetical protein
MKAYLVTTGALYGLIAVMHVVRAIAEWRRLTTDPWYFLAIVALGIVAAGLSVWSWRLLRQQSRS